MSETLQDILIYLGPSLPLAQAQSILPDARYLPPIQCGDILAAMRLQPKIIAIIDGYFDHCAAVWHKEILLAMQKGIQVFGACSMGALRAAELTTFGMIGIGKIYQDYHLGLCNDDDEVAVLHSPERFAYQALTDAMVNIRATVASACTDNVLTSDTANILLQQAKSLYYQQRTLGKACDLAIKSGAPLDEIQRFWQWSQAGGYKDQKQQDAIALLNHLKHLPDSAEPLNHNAIPTNRTKLLHSLRCQVACQSFPSVQSWLPVTEKVAYSASQSTADYTLLSKLSCGLALCYQMALNKKINAASNNLENFCLDYNMDLPLDFADIPVHKQRACLQRLNTIASLLGQEQISKQHMLPALKNLLILTGDHPVIDDGEHHDLQSLFRHLQQLHPERYSCLIWLATIWHFLQSTLDDNHWQISSEYLLQYSDHFREQHKLLNALDFKAWLSTNDLNENSYQIFIESCAIFDLVLSDHNWEAFDIQYTNEDNWWLLDCLYLTGYYTYFKRNIA